MFPEPSNYLFDTSEKSHTQRLVKAQYVDISKIFINLKPKTWVKITPQGAHALKNYAFKLGQVLNSIIS